MAIMVTLAGTSPQVRPRPSDHQILCSVSVKGSANRRKLTAKNIFDSHSTATRIDRIVSGALQFAYSL